VNATSTLELFLLIFDEPDLLIHVDAVHGRPCEQEGKIERVSVVGSDHSRSRFSEMFKESSNRRSLERAGGKKKSSNQHEDRARVDSQGELTSSASLKMTKGPS
jgi:hypothetical protein